MPQLQLERETVLSSLYARYLVTKDSVNNLSISSFEQKCMAYLTTAFNVEIQKQNVIYLFPKLNSAQKGLGHHSNLFLGNIL